MCRNREKSGVVLAAFGAGLLAATILPTKWTLLLLAAALVWLGYSSCKR